MALSASPSVEQMIRDINKDGFCVLKDAAKGQAAQEFETKKTPITTAEGLDFCRAHGFDPRITGIVESIFDWSRLGMFSALYPFPGCAHNFRVDRSGLKGLMVQIWSRGSKAVYYKGSHRLPLQPAKAHDGMFEIPHEQLNKGSDPVVVDLEEGGLVVLDLRLAFTAFRGYAVLFVFAVQELIDHWGKIRLPHSPELENKVAEIDGISEKIGTNFTFER
ncbi:MAG: hypothetical protein M4579_007011 [Chaenotheca gracillima]|nr:MAG: hypothetical protein M4579_007011 [Chaenotheca gracillima]